MITKITNKVRRLNSLKVWSAITGVALAVALVVTALPIGISVNDGLLSIGLRQAEANPDGWLTGWTYRVAVNITAAGESVSGFTVTGGATPLKLHTGNGANDADDVYFNEHCKDYFDDIRVTEDDGETLIPYYIRNSAQTTGELCVLTDVSTSITPVYIYYGNSAACRASDLHATFIGGEWERAGNVLYTGTPSGSSGSYNAWPSICRLHNGTLFAVWTSQSAHGDNNSGLFYSKSTNQGRTWSAPVEFVDTAYMNNCPGVDEFNIGGTYHIIVSFQTVDMGGAGYDANRKAYIIVSVDEGANWGDNSPDYDDGDIITVAGTGSGDDARGIYCRPIEYTQSGTQKIAVCTYNHYDDGSANGRLYFNYCSASDLTNWSETLISNDGDEANSGYESVEPRIIEVKDSGSLDGDFYVIAESYAGDNTPYYIRSKDYGVNWGTNVDCDDGLMADSGITQDDNDAMDIIRASDEALYLVYAENSLSNHATIKILKASAEDENITWDTTNYSLPWRYRGTLDDNDCVSPALCEITDGGQLGLIFYMGSSSVCNIHFYYVALGSFVGKAFSYSSTLKITYPGTTSWNDYVNVEEVVGSNNYAVKPVDPQAEHSVDDWWLEVRFRANDPAEYDQLLFMAADGSISDRAVCFYIRQYANELRVYDGGSSYSIYNPSEVIYRLFMRADEANSKAYYYLYNDTPSLLASRVDCTEAFGTPTEVDRIIMGSSGPVVECDVDFYEMTIRKYTATEPAWGGTSEEKTPMPDITNTPSTNNFGVLEVNTAANTAINYFQIENTGTGAVDVLIYGTDVTGGDDTWTLSDTATPDENVYGLKAGLDDDDDEFDIIVRKTETYNTLVAGLAEDATQDWGLKIYMPTSLSGYDNGQMSGTITLVASAA